MFGSFRQGWRIAAALLLAVAPVCALAQVPGTIDGLVLAAEGGPLRDVIVRVEGTTRVARSGADGRFRIVALPEGPYDLTARLLGRAEARISVSVRANAAASVEFVLGRSAELVAPVIVSTTREVQRHKIARSRLMFLTGRKSVAPAPRTPQAC